MCGAKLLAEVSLRDGKNSFAASLTVVGVRGVDARGFSEFTKFSKFLREKISRNPVVAESRGDEEETRRAEGVIKEEETDIGAPGAETGTAGSAKKEHGDEDGKPVPPAALPLGCDVYELLNKNHYE